MKLKVVFKIHCHCDMSQNKAGAACLYGKDNFQLGSIAWEKLWIVLCYLSFKRKNISFWRRKGNAEFIT